MLMPGFYLHLSDQDGYHRDPEGTEFPDLEAARHGAIVGLRDTLGGMLWTGELDIGAFIDIEDEQSRKVDTIYFADAVKITNRRADKAH